MHTRFPRNEPGQREFSRLQFYSLQFPGTLLFLTLPRLRGADPPPHPTRALRALGPLGPFGPKGQLGHGPFALSYPLESVPIQLVR